MEPTCSKKIVQKALIKLITTIGIILSFNNRVE